MSVVMRSRKDLTIEVEPPNRRLDALSRLLSARSICTAASIINGKLYLAANELYKGSKDNETKKSIQEIINYFSKLAKSESITEQERENIFLRICSSQRLGTIMKTPVPKELAAEIGKRVLNGENPTMMELRKLHKNNATVASVIYGEWSKLYIDFSKIEKTIISQDEQFFQLKTAFLSNNIETLAKENEGGVHAEMQILSIVAELAEKKQFAEEKEIYIGVSKLCCLNCRSFLEEANGVFKEKLINIVLETRGHHDLDFKWPVPDIFVNGFSGEKEETAADLIANRASSLIEELLEEEKPRANMDANDSESSVGSPSTLNMGERKKILQGELDFFRKLKENGITTIDQGEEMLLIAVNLHKLKKFGDLYRLAMVDELDKNEAINSFDSFSPLIKDMNIKPEFLLKTLQDPLLVGKTIANYFKEITPEQVLSKSEQINEVDMLPSLQDIKSEEEITQTAQTGNKKQKITGKELTGTSQSLSHPTQVQQQANPSVNLDNINAIATSSQQNPGIQQPGNTMLNAYHSQADSTSSSQTSSSPTSTNNNNSSQNNQKKDEVGKKRRPSK